jgi:UDP-N-acetyl-D-mannosaminuronate dehydrogenase
MSTSRIGVVGAGYVGLTTAACMASLGHDVVCGDVDVVKQVDDATWLEPKDRSPSTRLRRPTDRDRCGVQP